MIRWHYCTRSSWSLENQMWTFWS